MLPHFHLLIFCHLEVQTVLANNIWGIYFKVILKNIAEIASNAMWQRLAPRVCAVPLVYSLYNNALVTSSKKTYRSGTNHFRRFVATFPKLASISAQNPPPSEHILTLCFFAAKLFLKKLITSNKTIKS